jgi:hypothetical protein
MNLRRGKVMPGFLLLGIFLLAIIAMGGFGTKEVKAVSADHAVINEVSIDSVAGSGGTDDDWVELYNPTDQAINLTGWSIQKTAGTGSSLVKVPLSGSIPAGGYFLIVRDGAATAASLVSQADVLASNSFSLSQNNIVYLVSTTTTITNSADLNIVDFVGFGTVSFFEGSAAAPAIPETKSIARIPAGEDANQNSVDFQIQDTPTPTNAAASGSGTNDLGGTVLFTVAPDAVPVQNITASGAQIFFQTNAAGTAKIKFGLSSVYDLFTAPEAVLANTTKNINLSGLTCAMDYHYAIYAENSGVTENDQTADAVFTTLPCVGISIDSLAMTKSTAKANNQFADGWQWEFNITAWNLAETSLKMKFDQWSGAGVLSAADNMQYSVDNGANWVDITANGAYPAIGADISAIDNSVAAGRQVKILVRMKVPFGTAAGNYNSSYGILTE